MTSNTTDIAALRARCTFACALSRKVGQRARRFRDSQTPAGLGIETKGPQDFVTIADKEAEMTIRAELARAFPKDGFLGEETRGNAGANDTWVVDPIDGTTNYIRGLRHWGVSMAFVSEGCVRLGVIYDAPHDQLFWAIEGQGAYVDEAPLRAVAQSDIAASMVILGTSGRSELSNYLSLIAALHEAGAEHRRLGSAAIGLVCVAEGTADAYFEASLNAWDALAGLLIAAEAGALAFAPRLDAFLTEPGPVLAGSPELVELIFGADPEAPANLLPIRKTKQTVGA